MLFDEIVVADRLWLSSQIIEGIVNAVGVNATCLRLSSRLGVCMYTTLKLTVTLAKLMSTSYRCTGFRKWIYDPLSLQGALRTRVAGVNRESQ